MMRSWVWGFVEPLHDDYILIRLGQHSIGIHIRHRRGIETNSSVTCTADFMRRISLNPKPCPTTQCIGYEILES